MSGQSPSNGFWLPSPQYSESGWNAVHGSPESNPQYFHYRMPASSSGKPYQSQDYQNGSSGPWNMTPGLTPQPQSLQWQGPYQPDLPAQQQSHPSLSSSFMQQFDSANIEDPFTSDHNLDPLTPGFPLQTPPPTRDARRKPHQPRLPDFATPPTIRKRPMTSSGGCEGGPAVSSPDLFDYNTDASPFPFTPLQFSPPPGFAPSGPTTAPAQHGRVFWDSQSFPNFEPTFPTIAEDPFSSTPAPAAQHFSFSSPVPLIHHQYAASESYPGPPLHSHMRPQTARPVTAAPMHSIPAGINPNVLRASQSFAGQTETFRAIAAAGPSSPYATQKAALQREKSARAKKSAGRPSLRHANTDSTVSRSESPLKRQKSNPNPPMGTFATTPRRREVVLTVDEHGHASTMVIGDPLPPGSYSLAATDGEESEDVEGSVSASSDAQSAIKELRKK